MKITEVETFIVQGDLPRFVADSFNQAAVWGMPGVMIRTDEDVCGVGFSMTLGSGDHAIVDVIDRYYVTKLIGQDPLRHQYLWDRLYWSDAHWVGRLGITQMALAAVDVALWDLKAKRCGMPLWKLVGGHKDGRVRSYNTDGGWLNFTVEQIIDDMRSFIDQGWTGVKMKVGLPEPREDVRRVEAVRAAIGDDIDLMLDVNQRWDTTTAVTWAPRFEEFSIGWIEEPLDPDDVEGHARLAGATSIPIALGEHLYSRTQFRDYIERGIVGYVQPDITRLGGITEWLAVAEIALAHHIAVVPHAGDLMRVHQHLGVGHPAVPMIECIDWLQDLFEEPADIREGWFHVAETPGAGTTFDPEKFSKHRVS